MPPDDAVTVFINQLLAGDPTAARPLWDTYFQRLVVLARNRLGDAPRRVSDEEDVAQSAFASFCDKAEAGRFPDLTDRHSLWRLLAAFTLRKAAHHCRDACRLKRGGGVTTDDGSGVLKTVLGREPDPALPVEVADECHRLLSVLPTPELRRVALLRMDGHSVEEMAAEIGVCPRTVKRKLDRIRSIWKKEPGHGAD